MLGRAMGKVSFGMMETTDIAAVLAENRRARPTERRQRGWARWTGMALLGATLSALMVGAGCGGASAGETCDNDKDCQQGLSCQPIRNRAALYCCPIPAESSDAAECKPGTTNSADGG